MRIKERDTCRASGEKLITVFDMGTHPVSSFPSSKEEALEFYPLTLTLCSKSGLLQLKHTVDPDHMYNFYWYMSGINSSMKESLKNIVEEALLRNFKHLVPGDIVVDIASNDGTLLSAYPEGYFRVGIDPAKNIKPTSCDLHINDYFSKKKFIEAFGTKKAKIITSIAMFYDLENPVEFASDIQSILDENGMWIIELSYLPTMLQMNSIDTICAEHLEYYSLNSIEYILRKANLIVSDVELNSVNGGSFRLYVKHKGKAEESDNVRTMRQNEQVLDLLNPQTYIDFASRVSSNKRDLLEFLEEQKLKGKLVLGYGASTKGNTILSYYGIDSNLLPFIADRNPIKWNRMTVTGIPIISEEEAREMKPDYFLVFPYHFLNEFMERESQFLLRGGQFVSPIPKLTFFGLNDSISDNSKSKLICT